jgi:uncharacterized protein
MGELPSPTAAFSPDAPATLLEGKQTRRRTLCKRVLAYTILFLTAYLAFCAALTWQTVRPKLSRHKVTPAQYKLAFETIEFTSADGTRLSGWLMPAAGAAAKGVVILCHGVDSTRVAMLQKAAMLHKRGFSTLAFDFRGRGESGPSLCTIGYREVDDLLAAVQFVRSRPDLKGLPLGVFGESQGGAVALMGTARSQEIRAVAAESPFACLDNAIDNHFGSVFGAGAVLVAAPVRWIGQYLIRKRCCDIAPEQEISRIAPRPLLLIQDRDDVLCPPSETKALLAAAGEPKELWTVPSAGHIMAEVAAPDEFAKRVGEFFEKSLVVPAPSVRERTTH